MYNFWLLLCPERLSYDWQMGSLPLIHVSSVTNDVKYIAIPLFYSTMLWFIFVSLKRLLSQERQTTCKKEDNQMMIGVCILVKQITYSSFNFIFGSKKYSKNVSIFPGIVMINIRHFFCTSFHHFYLITRFFLKKDNFLNSCYEEYYKTALEWSKNKLVTM